MDNDFRARLYQLLSIEDESERESALEEIVNEYATYGSQVESLTAERDDLQGRLTKAETDRDTYKERLAKVVNSTLEPDKEDDEEVINYEDRVFKKEEE